MQDREGMEPGKGAGDNTLNFAGSAEKELRNTRRDTSGVNLKGRAERNVSANIEAATVFKAWNSKAEGRGGFVGSGAQGRCPALCTNNSLLQDLSLTPIETKEKPREGHGLEEFQRRKQQRSQWYRDKHIWD